MHEYASTLALNIDIPAGRGELHGESLRGESLLAERLCSKATPVKLYSPVSYLVHTLEFTPAPIPSTVVPHPDGIRDDGRARSQIFHGRHKSISQRRYGQEKGIAINKGDYTKYVIKL